MLSKNRSLLILFRSTRTLIGLIQADATWLDKFKCNPIVMFLTHAAYTINYHEEVYKVMLYCAYIMIIAAYVANYNVKWWSSRYSYQIILVLCRLHYAKQVAAQEHNSIVANKNMQLQYTGTMAVLLSLIRQVGAHLCP